jgi:phosphinothricin acetyltransferase
VIADSSAAEPFVVRDCEETDLAAVTTLYAHYVRTSLATFEEIPPTQQMMTQRFADVRQAGLPYLVATGADGELLGYTYASFYRIRSAYRFTVEDSIYVTPEAIRRDVGSAMLGRLIDRCTAGGFRQMVAIIGDSANVPSIGLHEKLGFARVGLLPAVGFKFDRWVDSVIMQRALGPGSASPPT